MKKKLMYYTQNNRRLKIKVVNYCPHNNPLSVLEIKLMTFSGFELTTDFTHWQLADNADLKFMSSEEFAIVYHRYTKYLTNLKFHACMYSNINRKFCKVNKIRIQPDQCTMCPTFQLDPKFDNLILKQMLVLE